MKWLPLLWAALRRKPARSLFTLLSLVIAFLMIGIMTGVSARIDEVIASAQPNKIVVNARFGAWIPVAYAEQIARLDGVTDISVGAVLGGTYQRPDNGIGIYMTDERSLRTEPDFRLTSEHFELLKATPNGVVMTRQAAERIGWKVGETYPLETDRVATDGTRNWTVKVVSIVEGQEPATQFAIGNFNYFNERRAERKGEVHNIALLVDDPNKAGPVSTAIERMFGNSGAPVSATPERTLRENGIRGVLDLEFVTYAVSAAALFMILFLTGNVLAQSVRERIPEFAVMKAVGFSDRGVFALVLAEATFICLLGAVLGLGAAKASPLLAQAILQGGPTPLITYGVIAFALVSAVIVAAISGLPAAWRVKRLEIAEALGGR
jgi:putative ABC transport system permease protein